HFFNICHSTPSCQFPPIFHIINSQCSPPPPTSWLLAHALRICGNTPVAQNAVQDTFISAFTHWQGLRNAEVFYPWLKKILVKNCYLLLRRERSVELKGKHTGTDRWLIQSVDEQMDFLSDKQLLFESLKGIS